MDLTFPANQAVVEMAIDAIVKNCVAKLVANEQASTISLFRSQCQNLVTTEEERQWMKRELHQTTLELRRGNLDGVCIDELVTKVQQRLQQRRREQKG